MENSEYTERIVTALKQLKNIHGPAALAYWVTPNTILTLSGVRAYCDGVFWSEDNNNLIQWVSEINKTCKTLSAIYDLVGCESGIEGAGQEKYASYEIITRPGLTYVLKNTTLLKDDITDKLLLQVDGRQKLQAALIKSLRQNQELAGFDKEYLEHTSFGILVGYPDQAILSALQYWQQEDKYLNPFAEPLVDADIRGGSYYDCPQPVYRYQRHLVNDPVIQQHEQLWSRILWEYYHSEFHKVLAENKAYQDKVREIGIANT